MRGRRSPWADEKGRGPAEREQEAQDRMELPQIGIRADRETIRRFRRLCRDDRRSYGEMLRILLDRFDQDPS